MADLHELTRTSRRTLTRTSSAADANELTRTSSTHEPHVGRARASAAHEPLPQLTRTNLGTSAFST